MITMHKLTQTRLTETYLIDWNGTLHTTKIVKHPKRRGIDNLRHAICRTLKINKDQFVFLGNRRVNGNWVTEWMMK